VRICEWEINGGDETTCSDPMDSQGQITLIFKDWMTKIEGFRNEEGLSGHPTFCGWTQLPSSGECRENEDLMMRGLIVIARVLEIEMDHKIHGFS